MKRGYTEFLCRVSSLVSVVGSLVGGGGRGRIYVVIRRGGSEQTEYSSYGKICGD